MWSGDERGSSPEPFVAGVSGDSGSSDSEAADPHQKLIVEKALSRRGAAAAADAADDDADDAPQQAPVRALKRRSGAPAPGGDEGIVVVYVDDEEAEDAAAAEPRAPPALPGARKRTHAAPVRMRFPRCTQRTDALCVCAAARSARLRAADASEGTPEEALAGDWGGESAEMRRLLRAPRYFDDDFEAVRGAQRVCNAQRAHAQRRCLRFRCPKSARAAPHAAPRCSERMPPLPASAPSQTGGAALLPLRRQRPPRARVHRRAARTPLLPLRCVRKTQKCTHTRTRIC
jgi:hypothetical protein